MLEPAGQTLDRFLDGRVVAAQPASGFRAGHDTVLLAAAVPAASGSVVIELGSGAGWRASASPRALPAPASPASRSIPISFASPTRTRRATQSPTVSRSSPPMWVSSLAHGGQRRPRLLQSAVPSRHRSSFARRRARPGDPRFAQRRHSVDGKGAVACPRRRNRHRHRPRRPRQGHPERRASVRRHRLPAACRAPVPSPSAPSFAS